MTDVGRSSKSSLRNSFAALAVLMTVAAGAQAASAFTRAELIEPQTLAAMLSKPRAPLVLQVGFRVLYDSAHIPGARYCGPASESGGLARLKQCAAALPRSRFIVIYCGCCPMVHCPNVRPAFALLQRMGFKHVKVLDLPSDFKTDWLEKGYPVSPAAKRKR